MCFENVSKKYYKKTKTWNKKRHAILQNYIMTYMVLIVYHHMLHMLMFIMAFCFLTSYVMTQATHALYLGSVSHATITLNVVIAFWQ